ncbi:MAG: hypothetical protein M3Y81_23600, partial [Chloroflexota bacterium]|nr:hypothetical protein [Chloroflexota bacterium]
SPQAQGPATRTRQAGSLRGSGIIRFRVRAPLRLPLPADTALRQGLRPARPRVPDAIKHAPMH